MDSRSDKIKRTSWIKTKGMTYKMAERQINSYSGIEWFELAEDREYWNKLEEAYTQIGFPIQGSE